MGFGGSKSSTPEPEPRSTPEEGTYAPRPDHDPIDVQLGINDHSPASSQLLDPKKRPAPGPSLMR